MGNGQRIAENVKDKVLVQFEVVAPKYFEHWRKQQKPSVSRATFGPRIEALNLTHDEAGEQSNVLWHLDTNEHKCKYTHLHKTRTKTMKYSYNVKDPAKQDLEREIWKRVMEILS